MDEEELSRNVARLVQLRVTDEQKVRSFTRAEALRFLKTAEQHRLYALWAVALSMGLRRGEALGLEWADVDLDQGRMTIRRALHRVDGQLKLENVKTEGSVAMLFTMGVQPATVQKILRHSSITVTTGTYVEVIEDGRHRVDAVFVKTRAASL